MFGHELKQMNSLEEAAGVRLDDVDTQRCFGCHTTGAGRGNRIYFDKLMPGVRCEACHGPGGDHVAAMQAGQAKEAKIFHPGKLGGDDLTQAFCATCHRSVEDVLEMQRQGSVMSVRFQPYRLYNSKCYSGDSRISCVAGHNPHRDARQDAAFYDIGLPRRHRKERRARPAVQSGDERLRVLPHAEDRTDRLPLQVHRPLDSRRKEGRLNSIAICAARACAALSGWTKADSSGPSIQRNVAGESSNYLPTP